MQIEKDPVRILFDQQSDDDAVDAITNSIPTAFRANDMRFELGFSKKAALLDVANWDSVQIVVKETDNIEGLPLMDKSTGDFNFTLTQEQWDAGTHQHCVIEFTGAETALPLNGAKEKNFTLICRAQTSLGSVITIGTATFRLRNDGTSGMPDIPPMGSTIIPLGQTYSGAGSFVQPTVAGNLYSYTKLANDTDVVNGTETISASGYFVAQGASVTLRGTASSLITALLRYPVFYTAEQVRALIAGLSKVINAPGVLTGWVSHVNTDVASPNFGKQFIRLEGVSTEGEPISQIKDLTAP